MSRKCVRSWFSFVLPMILGAPGISLAQEKQLPDYSVTLPSGQQTFSVNLDSLVRQQLDGSDGFNFSVVGTSGGVAADYSIDSSRNTLNVTVDNSRKATLTLDVKAEFLDPFKVYDNLSDAGDASYLGPQLSAMGLKKAKLLTSWAFYDIDQTTG
ncbi:MAG: hypothetical protein KDD60_10370, partial [Bdellovibrionales bacterium]|nr:hypothetical protein [Bdellovibrionales bacterium]